jgi:hypothetical protein
MANALYVDALKGYEFYLKKRGRTILDEINLNLVQEGRHEIAHRTYTHYHKLMVHGFRNYLPINKFDVMASLGHLQAAADRRNYSREAINLPILLSRDGLIWVDGFTIDRSIVGFGIKVEKKFPVAKLSAGWIRIKGFKDIPIVFIWRQHDKTSTRLGVRALGYIANYRLTPNELDIQRLHGILRISRDKGGEIEWVSLYGILVKTDELLKALSDMYYALEDAIGVEINIASPLLKGITFGSPGSFELRIDFGIADTLKFLLELFDKIRFWGLEKKKMIAEVEAKELGNAQVKFEIMRNVINFTKEVDDTELSSNAADCIISLLPSIFDTKKLPKELFAPDSPEMGILKKRIFPATTELLAGDDPEYKIEVISTKK